MPKTMIRGFEKSAETYDDHAIVQKLSSDYLADICSKFIKNPKDILDIGCGTGFTTIALQEYYTDAEYTLCDISEKMVEIAKRKASKGNYIICDAENYNFKNSYDLIVSNLAFQWFKNFEFFLGSILLKCEYLVFSILT
ncbi:MAG: methyltransferase domain-containing protein [Bacteroidales bacterium]|jgi:malonyl-CoA O-methyltransferase|nr:methyltransferase domain-containing protein [Bacteroidales bacterium]